MWMHQDAEIADLKRQFVKLKFDYGDLLEGSNVLDCLCVSFL